MEFARVTPESVGIPSSAIQATLDRLYGEGIEMHAFMLLRHGKVCAEGSWAPYHVPANRLKNLELNPMLGMRNPGGEASLNGAVYTPDQPLPGIRDIIGGVGCVVPQGGRLLSLGFCFEAGKAELVCHEETGESRVDLGMNGHFATTLIGDTPYGANSSWRDRDVLEVHLRNVRMAAGRRFQFRFAGDKMTICATPTLPDPLGLGELPLPKLNFSLM